jgi:hypothetical protein
MKKQIKSFIKRSKSRFKNSLFYLFDRNLKNSISKTVIINGFWRSGTTLLQTKICKSVKGKSVFEPFGPDVINDPIYLNSKLVKSNLPRNFHNSFMPFSSMKNESLEFEIFILKCFNANIKSAVVRRLRKSIKSSFYKTVVCKFVRGHLLLPYLLNKNPNMPVIHIYRNPKAVLASITRKGWGYWFKDFYLKDQLIEIDDERKVYFNQYKDLIQKYDNKDVHSRICAFWCLVERYIHDKCVPYSNFLYVSYEELITNDFEPIKVFLAKFDLNWYNNSVENLSSVTTNKNRKFMSKEEKRDSWKKELDVETQLKIDLILNDFDLDIINYQ